MCCVFATLGISDWLLQILHIVGLQTTVAEQQGDRSNRYVWEAAHGTFDMFICQSVEWHLPPTTVHKRTSAVW